MSLISNFKTVLTAVSTQINLIRTKIGKNSDLSTTHKSSLVGAVNEIKSLIDNSGSSNLTLNDADINIANCWSSQKINDTINLAIAQLTNGASGAMDTLKELEDAIKNNNVDVAVILTNMQNHVSINADQKLTAVQKNNARRNIDIYSKTEIGDINTDLAAHFKTGLS